MANATSVDREAARLGALGRYAILDTPPEAAFDELAALAARALGTSIALISFVDADRQWVKAAHGLAPRELPRDVGGCPLVLEGGAPIAIADLSCDPRVCPLPFELDGAPLRFYAGAPIIAPDGEVLGTVCALDRAPRQVDAAALDALVTIARQVAVHLELCRVRGELERAPRGSAAGQSGESSTALLARLSAHLPVGVIELDHRGLCTFVNQRWCEITGIPAAEALGKSWQELDATDFSSTDRRQRWVEILASRGEGRAESRIVRRNGSEAWVAARVVAMDHGEGRVGFIATLADVTASKRAEEALRSSEERWRLALRGSLDGVWDWDIPGSRFFFSGELERSLGYDEGELDTTPSVWMDLCHPDDRELTRAAFRAHAAGEREMIEIEHRLVLKDGDWRWVLTRGRITQRDASGKPLRVTGTYRDISARRAAEELLRSSEERLRLALEIGNLATWEWDLESGEVIRSGEIERLFGVHPGQLERTPEALLSRIHADDRPRVRRALEDAITGGGTYRAEYRILFPDGSARWCAGVGRVVADESGRRTRMIGLGMDIGERKRAELEREELLAREKRAREEAQAANRAKDEFLAVLSHELRTPLNAILGFTQLLRSGALDPEETASALETIERNARAQHQLIADLLDVSRIVQGEMRLEVATCELDAVVLAGIETLRPAAAARGIHVRTALGDVRPIHADGRRIQQIVWNLVANAIKFSPRDGAVDVELREVGDAVEIVVRDAGVGIAADFLPYVFERFRQADSSSTRQYGGLGLGLAIVRHLAELHGGSVSASSAGPGQGACFTVALPRATEQAQGAADGRAGRAPEPTAVPARPLAGLRLLVVDDEPDARNLLSTSLRKSGADVLAVGSAAEALREVERARPDVLIADVAMPETDGFALLDELRRRECGGGARLPAVAVTALTGEDTLRRIAAAGFDLHATKPFEPRSLVALIQQLRPPA